MKLARYDRKLLHKLQRGERLTRGQKAHLARLEVRLHAMKAHKSNPAPRGCGLAFNGAVGCTGGL